MKKAMNVEAFVKALKLTPVFKSSREEIEVKHIRLKPSGAADERLF